MLDDIFSMKILETILEEVELININEIFFFFRIMSLNNDAIKYYTEDRVLIILSVIKYR